MAHWVHFSFLYNPCCPFVYMPWDIVSLLVAKTCMGIRAHTHTHTHMQDCSLVDSHQLPLFHQPGFGLGKSLPFMFEF